jgi:hypothetical protein
MLDLLFPGMVDSLVDDVRRMSVGRYLWWLVVSAGVGLFLLWMGTSLLRQAGTLGATPHSKIRSAAQRFVTLQGQAACGPDGTVLAPLSKRPVCWWRYEILQRRSNGTTRIESVASDAVVLLDDGTGRCRLDLSNADVTLQRTRSWRTRSDLFRPQRISPDDVAMQRHFVDDQERDVAYAMSGLYYELREEVLLPGDPVFASGQFHTQASKGTQDEQHELRRSDGQPFVVSAGNGRESFHAHRSIGWTALILSLWAFGWTSFLLWAAHRGG